MAEIFISYARGDRERAQALAGALGREGWSVWWDRDIPPGRTFDDVIEEALGAAKCVIVLWTRQSIRSEWVKAEASEAARRRILVPVLTDQVMPPLEFRRIQAASLLGADLSSNPDWSQFCQAVGELVGRPPSQPTASASTGAAAPPSAPRPSLRVASSFLGALAVVVIGWVAVAVRPGPTEDPPVVVPVPSVPNVSVRPDDRDFRAGDQTPQAKPTDTAAVPSKPPGQSHQPTKVPATGPPSAVSSKAGMIVSPGKTSPPGMVPNPADLLEVTPPLASPPIGIPPSPASGAASFDVTYTHGVFRESGRLTVSLDGVRYAQPDGRSTFSAACGDLKSVREMTVIVDGEQRMVELHTKDRVHRFTTDSKAARNLLVSALSWTCGTR